MSTARKGYTETISTAEFTTTPRVIVEQPTGSVHVEAWDRSEVEVSVPGEDAGFEVEQSGSTITVKRRPGRTRIVNFLDPVREDLSNLGLDVERVAARVEKGVERSMRRFGLGAGFDPTQWIGGAEYSIRVPHNCDLNLRTSSGDLSVQGVTGTLYLQTTSGDAKVQSVGGSLVLNSASGDLRIEGMEGTLGARTASGDLRARGLRLDDVSVSTASGDIELELEKLPQRDFEVKTVSGDIELKLPDGSRATFEFHTISGEIRCGFSREQVSYKVGRNRQTTLQLNGEGGPLVRLGSISGDLLITKGRGSAHGHAASTVSGMPETGSPTMDLSRMAPPTPPSPASEPRMPRTPAMPEDPVSPELAHEPEAAHADRVEPEGYVERERSELEILQAVERGEMSAQEAMRRLSELTDPE